MHVNRKGRRTVLLVLVLVLASGSVMAWALVFAEGGALAVGTATAQRDHVGTALVERRTTAAPSAVAVRPPRPALPSLDQLALQAAEIGDRLQRRREDTFAELQRDCAPEPSVLLDLRKQGQEWQLATLELFRRTRRGELERKDYRAQERKLNLAYSAGFCRRLTAAHVQGNCARWLGNCRDR